MTILEHEHLETYKGVADFIKITHNIPVTTTILTGRPEEVLDDDSFKWKVLKDKFYPFEKVTRATYVYQEGHQVSFISVIINSESSWAHGMVLTSVEPMSAKRWLGMVTAADLAVHNFHIPGGHVHQLLPNDNYGDI